MDRQSRSSSKSGKIRSNLVFRIRDTDAYKRITHSLNNILSDPTREEVDENALNYLACELSSRASINRKNKSYRYIKKLMMTWAREGYVDTALIEEDRLTELQYERLMEELQNLAGGCRG